MDFVRLLSLLLSVMCDKLGALEERAGEVPGLCNRFGVVRSGGSQIGGRVAADPEAVGKEFRAVLHSKCKRLVTLRRKRLFCK